MHDPDRTRVDLVGYAQCENYCGQIVRIEVARITGGLCDSCWRAQRDEGRLVELRHKGAALQIPLDPRRTARNRRKNRKRAADPAYRRRKSESERAKLAAMRRLRQLFPELYDTLVAEERARRGLEPWPTATALQAHQPDDFAEVYDALVSEGIQL